MTLNFAVMKLGALSLLVTYVLIQFLSGKMVSAGGGDYVAYILAAVAGVVMAQNGFMDKALSVSPKLHVRLLEFFGCIIVI